MRDWSEFYNIPLSEEGQARWRRLCDLLDRDIDIVPAAPRQTEQEYMNGEVPPLEQGHNMLDWVMFVDDWSGNEELRAAIMSGPWELVEMRVDKILDLVGVK